MLAAYLLHLETPGLPAWYPLTRNPPSNRRNALVQGCRPGAGMPPRHRRNLEARGPTSWQMFQYSICPPLKPRWASSVTLSVEVPLRQPRESEPFQLRQLANGLSVRTAKALLPTRKFCEPGGPTPQPPAVSILLCPSWPSILRVPPTIHPDCPRQTRADRAPPALLWETLHLPEARG